jgi:hypothetical protein
MEHDASPPTVTSAKPPVATLSVESYFAADSPRHPFSSRTTMAASSSEPQHGGTKFPSSASPAIATGGGPSAESFTFESSKVAGGESGFSPRGFDTIETERVEGSCIRDRKSETEATHSNAVKTELAPKGSPVEIRGSLEDTSGRTWEGSPAKRIGTAKSNTDERKSGTGSMGSFGGGPTLETASCHKRLGETGGKSDRKGAIVYVSGPSETGLSETAGEVAEESPITGVKTLGSVNRERSFGGEIGQVARGGLLGDAELQPERADAVLKQDKNAQQASAKTTESSIAFADVHLKPQESPANVLPSQGGLETKTPKVAAGEESGARAHRVCGCSWHVQSGSGTSVTVRMLFEEVTGGEDYATQDDLKRFVRTTQKGPMGKKDGGSHVHGAAKRERHRPHLRRYSLLSA